MAEHHPDLGHVIKDQNNAFYKLRSSNPSWNGQDLLSNQRIKSMHTDMRKPIEEYSQHIGDSSERKKCLNQLRAIPYHHSNRHYRCFQDKYCSFRKVKNAHPDWTKEQVHEEVANGKDNKTLRHGGKFISLSKEAVRTLVKECIEVWFNEKSIDRIAKMASSNASEGCFSMLTQYTDGKRINVDHSDLWKAVTELTACNAGKGNKRKTLMETSNLLCMPVTPVQTDRLSVVEKSRRKITFVQLVRKLK